MRKKWIAVIAAVIIAIGMLSSCTQEDKDKIHLDSKNPVTIEVWHYYNGAQKAAFDKLITEFNETVGMEKGIIVEGVNQGNVNELMEKIIDSANKKVGSDPIPNVFAAYADTAWQIDQMGLVADLGQYLTQEEISEYIPSYIEEGRMGADQALKIFPTAKSTEVLMLNKTDWDKFAEATGASLEELKTIEGITRLSEKYYEWTDSLTPDIPEDGKAFFGRDAMANYLIIGSKQLGTEIFTVKGGKVEFKIEEEVFRRLWDHYYVPFINGYFAANGKFRSDDAKVGDLIALVGSTTSATYFPSEVMSGEESYPIDSLVMPAPRFENGAAYSVQQGAGMVVSKSTKEKEYASVLFLKWFTEAERNLEFAAFSGYLPVKESANDIDKLHKLLEKSGNTMSDTMKKTFDAAFQVTSEQRLYTNQAFTGGTDARAVLENSLSGKAAADRAQVVSKMQAGASRAEAVAEFNTQENFSAWLQTVREALLQTQKDVL